MIYDSKEDQNVSTSEYSPPLLQAPLTRAHAHTHARGGKHSPHSPHSPTRHEQLIAAMDADDIRGMGGQHRPTVGVSTFDDETPSETAERHRRAIEEFNAAMQEAVSQQFGQKF